MLGANFPAKSPVVQSMGSFNNDFSQGFKSISIHKIQCAFMIFAVGKCTAKDLNFF